MTPHSRALAFCARMGWDSPDDVEAVEGLVRSVVEECAKVCDGRASLLREIFGPQADTESSVGAWDQAAGEIRSLAPASEKEER